MVYAPLDSNNLGTDTSFHVTALSRARLKRLYCSVWSCQCLEHAWEKLSWCSNTEVCAGEDLVNMSPEELASDARKSQNAQIRKEALKESERGQHMKKVQGIAISLQLYALCISCTSRVCSLVLKPAVQCCCFWVVAEQEKVNKTCLQDMSEADRAFWPPLM